MTKRLRFRFVCITMAIVLVILLAIFGFMIHFTRQTLERASVSMLRTVAADPLQLDWPGTSSARLPYFTVRIDITGIGRVTGTSYYDLTDSRLLSSLVETALQGEECGYIADFNLRYLRTVSYGSQYIIFADVSSESATMHSLTRICLLIGLSAMAVLLMISILLSRWAVLPEEKAWKQQKQFVSDASHELKTPLTVILTNAEMLRSGEFSEEDRERSAESILTMSKKMRGLVESLLTLARADNGAVPDTRSDLDLSALVEDALLPFEAVFFERQLTLESSVEPGLLCRGSEESLRRAVEVLLDNAQKYSDTPGTVRVTLARHGHKSVLLTVATPGEPLSPEECLAVFRRFYRTNKAHSSDGSYGLGLSIAESIVADHHGKIWAEGTDTGNRFFIQLPLLS